MHDVARFLKMTASFSIHLMLSVTKKLGDEAELHVNLLQIDSHFTQHLSAEKEAASYEIRFLKIKTLLEINARD